MWCALSFRAYCQPLTVLSHLPGVFRGVGDTTPIMIIASKGKDRSKIMTWTRRWIEIKIGFIQG